MDYEKKYKEALEWARKVMQWKVGFVLDEVLEKFPELKKSDDERIRESLAAYFAKFKPNDMWDDDFSFGDILAWFEKQGEKDEEILILKDQIESLHAAIKALKEAHKIELEKQGEQKLPIEKLPFEMKTVSESLWFTSKKECDDYNKMVTNLIMSDDDNGEQKGLKKEKVDNLHNYLYGEQKPVEIRTTGYWHVEDVEQNRAWSEEDEMHIRELESLVKQVWATAEHENDKNTIHKMSDLSFFLKTLKPQLKQEWSEEDEETLNDIITSMTNLKDSATSDALRDIYNSKIDWLKSLRPQNT